GPPEEEEQEDGGHPVEEGGVLEAQEDLDAHEGAGDEDLRMGEVDEFEHAVHHRVAERDESVHEAEDQAVEQDLGKDPEEEREVHRVDAEGDEGGGGRAALYIFGAGLAISSRFTSRFSPHFSGLSEVTCRTK